VVIVGFLFAGVAVSARLVLRVDAHVAAGVLVGGLAIVVLVASQQTRASSLR
jgi:hypothetical protein